MIETVIADNQPLTAAGLDFFLADKPTIRVVGRVNQGSDLASVIGKLRPKLLIVDYNLPGYVALDDIRNAMATSSNTNVLILSSDNNKSSILDALQLGIKGYITKDCSLDEVGMAIHATARGEKFFCHKILDIIMEKRFQHEPEIETSQLTTRETEILKFLANGNSTQKIAEKLFLSPHTVQTHRKSIIKKLNIKSPTEFVIYAMDMGLLKIR